METILLEQEVAKLIVQTLKLKADPSTIDPEAALFGEGLGLDSIDALELSLAIRVSTQVERSRDQGNFFIFTGADQGDRKEPHQVIHVVPC